MRNPHIFLTDQVLFPSYISHLKLESSEAFQKNEWFNFLYGVRGSSHCGVGLFYFCELIRNPFVFSAGRIQQIINLDGKVFNSLS